MRAFFRILKSILLGVLSFLVVTAFALLIAFQRPSVLVNAKTLNWAIMLLNWREARHFKIEWRAVRVEADSLTFFDKRFRFRFDSLCYQSRSSGKLSACFETTDLGFDVNLKAFPPRISRVGPVRFDGGDIKPAPGQDIRLNVEAMQAAPRIYAYRIRGTFAQAHERISARVRGLIRPGQIAGTIDAEALGLIPEQFKNPHLEDCGFSLDRVRLPEARAPAGKFHLDCPVRMFADLTRFAPSPEMAGRLKLPTRLGAVLTADLTIARYTGLLPDFSEPLSGRIQLGLDPVTTTLFEVRGGAAMDVAGVPSNFPENWKTETRVSARLDVPDFSRTVRELNDTSWAVWAPFNDLNGTLTFGVEGVLDPNTGTLPVQLTTRLISQVQQVDLQGTGVVSLNRDPEGVRTDLKVGVLLTNVRLALPRLDLSSPPRVLPDPRFKTAKTKAEAEAAFNAPPPLFTYEIDVKTPPGRPVRVISNLAKAQIPLELDLKVSSEQPLGGYIQVANFPVELFRRDATVEKIRIQFRPQEEGLPPINTIDGSIRVTYADYIVHILLLGSFESPRISLTSEPPLSDKQVVAVLLFGQPLEQLEPDQGDSAGNLSGAIADQAVGLASLYLLASTPVQSIGYDPSTHQLSAIIKLGEGTSLYVGTTGITGTVNNLAPQSGQTTTTAQATSVPEVGFRKRISKFWTIVTEVGQHVGETRQNVSAFLEWQNRY